MWSGLTSMYTKQIVEKTYNSKFRENARSCFLFCHVHVSVHRVVNKDRCLSPSTSLSSLWFLLLACIASVVGIHRTCRLGHLSLAYLVPAVHIHRAHLSSMENTSMLKEADH